MQVDPEPDDSDALWHHETGLSALLLRPLEQRLRLPRTYIMSLKLEPSDWVFIAKLGLLVEAALTEYLVLELGRPETYEHLSGTDQAKRLKLAGVLGLLEDDDRALLQMLSEVRNAFVHKLENLNRPLSEYVAGLSVSRKNQIATLLVGADVLKSIKANGGDFLEILPERFRDLLLTGAVLPLITISARHNSRMSDQERAEWQAANPVEIAVTATLPPMTVSMQIDVTPPPSDETSHG